MEFARLLVAANRASAVRRLPFRVWCSPCKAPAIWMVIGRVDRTRHLDVKT